MSAVVSLDGLLATRRLWRGQPIAAPGSEESTGHDALDALLPTGGWPEGSLIEILLPSDGIGELQLVLPTLARHTQARQQVALIAPPYVPNPHAWIAAGVDFSNVQIIAADAKNALWASEQCLRAGCFSAVLCWPRTITDQELRRLQVAAESGHCLAFAFRDRKAALNASPAPLRLIVESGSLRVLKCRGGLPPTQSISFAAFG
jgi:cell division inhibitor SulA